jgi:hypothetical protein
MSADIRRNLQRAARRQIRQLAEHRIIADHLTDELTQQRKDDIASDACQALIKEAREKFGLHFATVETVDWIASCFACLLDDADRDEQVASNAEHRSRIDRGLKELAEKQLREYKDQMVRGLSMPTSMHREMIADLYETIATMESALKQGGDVIPRSVAIKMVSDAVQQEQNRRR